MRYSDIRHPSQIVEAPLEEAPPKKPIAAEEKYGTWLIKYRLEAKDGKYDAIGTNPRHPTTVKGSGSGQAQAIAAVKADIDRLIKNDDTVLNFSKGAIDFNVEFTRECMEHGPTGVRLLRRGDESILVVCSENYAGEFGDEIYGSGEDQFTKVHARKRGSDDATSGAGTLYAAAITTKKIRELGLQPNGRYSLTYLNQDVDYGHRIYKLVFDSITASVNDKQRLHTPGLTLAVS